MSRPAVIRALRELGAALLDFIYPAHCSLCQAPLSAEERVVCEGCWRKIEVVTGPHCAACGSPSEDSVRTCGHCEKRPQRYDRARILSPFDETLQGLIHQLKYRGKRSVGHRLGTMLGQLMAADGGEGGWELLVPVPLHKSRKKERGYNQSAILAHAMAEQMGIEVRTDLLVRKRRTATQTKLSAQERARNVAGAFGVPHPEWVRGRTILLVDDVWTTGATVNACTEVLLNAGARRVSLAALTHPYSDDTGMAAGSGSDLKR
ncbi:MAG: ComF family protein [Candidatus Latescibacterota bacterium]